MEVGMEVRCARVGVEVRCVRVDDGGGYGGEVCEGG